MKNVTFRLPQIQIFYNLRRSPEAAGIVFRHFGAQLRKANHCKQVVRSTLLHLLNSPPLGPRGARWALAPRFAFACCAVNVFTVMMWTQTHIRYA